MPFTVVFSVVTGQRPQRPAPEDCETELKDRMWLLIEDCWKQDPIERPSMSEVEQKLWSFSQRHSTVSSAGRLSHRELVRLSIVPALPPVNPPPSPPPSSNVPLVRSPSIHSLHHATPVIDQSFPNMDLYPRLGLMDHPETEAEQLPRYSSIIHRDSSSSTESFQALLGNYLYSSDDNLISSIPSTPPNAADISNTSTLVETRPGAVLRDVPVPSTEPISPTHVSVLLCLVFIYLTHRRQEGREHRLRMTPTTCRHPGRTRDLIRIAMLQTVIVRIDARTLYPSSHSVRRMLMRVPRKRRYPKSASHLGQTAFPLWAPSDLLAMILRLTSGKRLTRKWNMS